MKLYAVSRDELHEYNDEVEPYEYLVIKVSELQTRLEKEIETSGKDVSESREVLRKSLRKGVSADCMIDEVLFLLDRETEKEVLEYLKKELLASLNDVSSPKASFNSVSRKEGLEEAGGNE